MTHIMSSLLILLAAVGSPEPVEKKLDGIELTLYIRNVHVVRGEPSAAVVEVQNNTDHDISFYDHVFVIPPEPPPATGRFALPKRPEPKPAADDHLYAVQLICRLPPGVTPNLIVGGTEPYGLSQVKVLPKKTLLLKATLAANLFPLGPFEIEAATGKNQSVSRSNKQIIQVVSSKEDLEKLEKSHK